MYNWYSELYTICEIARSIVSLQNVLDFEFIYILRCCKKYLAVPKGTSDPSLGTTG